MEDYIKMIRKLAWDFHKSTGVDVDDLFQEAAEGWCKGLKTYTPDKGAITTHMWHCMSNQLRNYLKAEREWNAPLCDLEELHKVEYNVDHFMESLPPEVMEVVDIILADPVAFDILNRLDARVKIREIQWRNGRTLKEVRSVENTLRKIWSL